MEKKTKVIAGLVGWLAAVFLASLKVKGQQDARPVEQYTAVHSMPVSQIHPKDKLKNVRRQEQRTQRDLNQLRKKREAIERAKNAQLNLKRIL